MKSYTTPTTTRRMARGTEQIAFPRGEAKPPPPRPTMLDAIATFQLYFDGNKPGGAT